CGKTCCECWSSWRSQSAIGSEIIFCSDALCASHLSFEQRSETAATAPIVGTFSRSIAGSPELLPAGQSSPALQRVESLCCDARRLHLRFAKARACVYRLTSAERWQHGRVDCESRANTACPRPDRSRLFRPIFYRWAGSVRVVE